MKDNVEIQISCENNLTDRLAVACQAFSRLEHAALHRIGFEPGYVLDEEQVVYEDPMWPKENPFLKVGDSLKSVAAAAELASEAIIEAARAIGGFIATTLEDCPNRRVVHLALHGKKKRTRKKNLRRACRMIVEKEAGQW